MSSSSPPLNLPGSQGSNPDSSVPISSSPLEVKNEARESGASSSGEREEIKPFSPSTLQGSAIPEELRAPGTSSVYETRGKTQALPPVGSEGDVSQGGIEGGKGLGVWSEGANYSSNRNPTNNSSNMSADAEDNTRIPSSPLSPFPTEEKNGNEYKPPEYKNNGAVHPPVGSDSRRNRPRAHSFMLNDNYKIITGSRRRFSQLGNLSSHSSMKDCLFSNSAVAEGAGSPTEMLQTLSQNGANSSSLHFRGHRRSLRDEENNEELEEYEESLEELELMHTGDSIILTSSPLAPPKLKKPISRPGMGSLLPHTSAGEAVSSQTEGHRVGSRELSSDHHSLSLPLDQQYEGRPERSAVVASGEANPTEGEGSAQHTEVQQEVPVEPTRRIPTGWGVRSQRTGVMPSVINSSSALTGQELLASLRTRAYLLEDTNRLGRVAETQDVSRQRVRRTSLTAEERESLAALHNMPRYTVNAPLRLLHAVILQEYLTFKQKLFNLRLFFPCQKNVYLKNHLEGEIKWNQSFWESLPEYNPPLDYAYRARSREKSLFLPTTAASANSNAGFPSSMNHNIDGPESVGMPSILEFSSSALQPKRVDESDSACYTLRDHSAMDTVELSPRLKDRESLPEFSERDAFLNRGLLGSTGYVSPLNSSPLQLYQTRRRSEFSQRQGGSLSLSRMCFLNCHHLCYRCCCTRCALAQQTSLLYLDGERQRLVPIPFLCPKLYPHPIQYSTAVCATSCIDALTCGFCCPCFGYNGVGTALFGWRLRYWVRCRYGLHGTGFGDLMTMLLCPVLASDQIGFELESRGVHEQWTPFVSTVLGHLNFMYTIK